MTVQDGGKNDRRGSYTMEVHRESGELDHAAVTSATNSPESKKKNQEILLDLQSKEGKYTPFSGLFKSTMSKEEINLLFTELGLGSIDDYFFNTKKEAQDEQHKPTGMNKTK